ncbi:hypothetical protein EV144_1011351 [Flavobacterium sp. 270]|uniref:hypothetical protein n=1 Tax=Flavobacterium sp. 270 TaxID=2512114 RepID=UPI0010647AC4|nr:hypothetical protein [Flavobacterium sp. 270]TDW52660.1 hypothetical protein EV144_1011351 [Flavobacterium sp. 270]
MNNNLYTYCLLKYKHSPFLEESLNIGVLIYFYNSRRFVFKYSKTLNRIKSIYENVPEKTVKEYTKQIDITLKRFKDTYDNLFPLNDSSLKHFLSSTILPKDDSVLQFCNFRTDSLRGFTEEFIESILIDKLFVEDIKQYHYQPQEPKILSRLYNNLKKLGFDEYKHNNDRFREDYILTNEAGTEFKFDIAWQNGTLNLIKPISFDLKESRSIADKAHKNFGQFYDLQQEAINNKLRYDLIVGEPNDSRLYKEFEHAISLLDNLPNVKIIHDSELELYSEKIVSAIL